MANCYIVNALRTPIGNFGKGLASILAPELAGLLVREFIEREACGPEQVDQAIFGNVLQGGLGMNPARQAAIKGGLPYDVPAYTVNMVCASGLYSIVLGDQAIRHGQARTVIAGGFHQRLQGILAEMKELESRQQLISQLKMVIDSSEQILRRLKEDLARQARELFDSPTTKPAP